MIHVAKELDGMPAADTHLCFVGRDGITRRRSALGHATCGMAGPVPCAWALQATTSRLLAFGSYRGHFKLVDAATGVDLPLALPPGAYPDGGSPGGFFPCGVGICLSYAMPSGDTASSAIRFAGGIASVGPAPARRESRWCAHEGLPVPREICDPTRGS